MLEKFKQLLERTIGKPAPESPPPAKGAGGQPATAAPAKTRAAAPSVPRICTDPSQYARVRGGECWLFQVPDRECACAAALKLHNHEVGAEHAKPVPLPGCERKDCRCNYRLVANKRQRARRSGGQRREEIRFEAKKGDRRQTDGRRKEDGWSGPKP